MKIKFKHAVFFMILGLAGITKEAKATNLLMDPGFENDTQLNAWIYWDDTGRAPWAKRDGFSGAYFRDWNDFGDGPPHSGGLYQDVKVSAGEKYTFAIWMRKEKAFSAEEIRISVVYFNSRFRKLDSTSKTLNNKMPHEWKKYRITTLAPPGTVTARVMITFAGGKGETGKEKSFLMDDAVFEPTGRN